jgi:predicted nuclease of predicted toxin-antitoxin system
MKFKLDENLGRQTAKILQTAGYDVTSVPDQKLSGSADKVLIEVCLKEGRCLITLDLEFGNPLMFNPSDYPGIVVMRLPSKPSPQDLLDIVRTFTIALGQKDIGGKLWVIQRDRVREYQPEDENNHDS